LGKGFDKKRYKGIPMIEQKAIEDCMCVDKSKCGHPKEVKISEDERQFLEEVNKILKKLYEKLMKLAGD